MNTDAAELRSQLLEIASDPDTAIRKDVAEEALEYGTEDLVSFFTDLLTHGCASGMVGSLIYYCDTHAFFDLHYLEIEQLRDEYEDMLGEPLQIKGDLKNWLAWFAFEETARQLADELGLEV